MKPILLSIFLAILGLVTVRAGDAPPPGPIYVVAYVDVLAGAAPQATLSLEQYRDASRREPGARGVDLYKQKGRANGFALTEVWQDNAAYERHGKAAAAAQLTDALKLLQLGPWDVRAHTTYAGDAAALANANADAGAGAITLLVHVDVPPPFLADSEKILSAYIDSSRRDAGLLHFAMFRALAPRINHFTVMQTWENEAALEAHQKAAHTRSYRANLAPNLGALYDERAYQKVVP
jgi:quinol monooxygenase YgiN